jgi:hypothetical protein
MLWHAPSTPRRLSPPALLSDTPVIATPGQVWRARLGVCTIAYAR